MNETTTTRRDKVGRGRWIGAAAIALLLAVWLLIGPPAGAAAITVNTTADELNDDGDCSLREAIIAANTDTPVDGCLAGRAKDTISIPKGTYVFSRAGKDEDMSKTGDLDITESVVIIGTGRASTIIDANGLDRVFHVTAGLTTLQNLTITGGGGDPGHGGGISVNGASLTIINSHITANESNGSGGGISFSNGSDVLTVINSQITNNEAHESGGGIFTNGTLVLTDSDVGENEGSYGGGVANHFDSVIIINSTIRDNAGTRATSGGGGIYSSGELTIVNSTLTGNSTIHSGGGINQGGTGTSQLYNVTITRNVADSDLTSGGDGGGVHIGEDAQLFAQNSIIAENIDQSLTPNHPNCSGELDSRGHNLFGFTEGCVISGITTGNLKNVASQTGPLKDNGGPTLTHALGLNSPAIDAGPIKGCFGPEGELLKVDQRGYMRAVDGDIDADIRCDMGAFEFKSIIAPTATPTSTPTSTNTPPPTATQTATATATKTPTPTATATLGPSPTPSKTPTPSATPTDGPSPTPTATPTEGPSPTPTKTPKPSATPTDGPSPTPTATATEGPSPTPTATATEGPSPTPTATSTVGPSPTPFTPTNWLYLPVVIRE